MVLLSLSRLFEFPCHARHAHHTYHSFLARRTRHYREMVVAPMHGELSLSFLFRGSIDVLSYIKKYFIVYFEVLLLLYLFAHDGLSRDP